ncbi:MAG TPA: 16S rRNA (uracil(1498)-N(3))-methyltransferase, partial [Cryptosporangiaceae bacterium]|nr:16S rRNA (uracil(1498)-N(3))-methyltransferase [Cryptosporangiaceae bacterium]
MGALTDPVFLVPSLPAGESAVLDGPEGRHAATVRRLVPGEQLVLCDGAGGMAECAVIRVRRDVLDVAVLGRYQVPPPALQVTVVQALPKGDRGELAVELLTEAGVDTVVPWQAARCVTRWRDGRADKALARWRSTAREAAKQARRAWLPVVTGLASTAGVARFLAGVEAAFVLHEEANRPLASVALPEVGTVALVVGPEGGVSPAEVDAFLAAGAVPVRLGPTVLRTST